MYLNNHVLLFYNMSGTLFNEEMFIQERIEPTYAPAQTLFFDPFVGGDWHLGQPQNKIKQIFWKWSAYFWNRISTDIWKK